ncbi:hypothetical protein J7E99_31320 [Streptomyces sp. ISL-44]|uniref:hypothetical protein n=1 Tax=Streptomyces sp. ISL-44 TaxID=2819184 RepID=UPI001BECF070|nr:hypothetical protein [Streptomyces sp. ISL-44]MBT2545071.1 hypothetical protein [Streptomyces sp. ISL-44]
MFARSTTVSAAVLAGCLVLTACDPAEPATDDAGQPASTSPSSSAAEPFAGKTPEEIQQLAYEETRTATFKKFRGQASGDGLTGTMELTFVNVDCAGTVSGEGLGKTEIHATPQVLHVKRDPEAWRAALKATKAQEDVVVNRIGNRWIKLDAEHSDAKAIAFSCQLRDPNILLEEESPEISRGASATVDGKPAIMLTYPGTNGGTVTDYVATQGRPYLLKRTETGRQPTEFTWYDFEAVTQIRPPAASEVVDAGEL